MIRSIDDILWMPLMLAGRPFSGYFIFDGDMMLDHRIDSQERQGDEHADET